LKGCDLKKQSQFSEGQNVAMPVMIIVYGGFIGKEQRKNKAKQSQTKPNKANLPIFGRKSEILSSNS